MAELDPDLVGMVANRARYQRIKTLLQAMGIKGSDAASFYATGDMVTEWLAYMPPEMRKLLRFSSMLAIHRHMSRTSTIRGVLAFDQESIAEWKCMQTAVVQSRLVPTYYSRQGQQDD
ncbi:MAG: hypothetical protein ACOH2M_01290 [Cypionkella sp.]